ncbi:MAG: nucleoside hydrolase [Trueperaceae bacterium]
MVRKIIYDFDAGHDDVVAWSLLHASPELELLGVTCVFGNTSLERVWRNALYTKNILGSTVPIKAGASGPLLRDRINAEVAHGPSGLHGVNDLPPETPITFNRDAVQFIIETVLAHPGEVTLVPVGPLTNIALTLRLEPRIIPAIKEIAFMGGSLLRGNFTPAAEFNTLADPHAAQIVFESGVPLAMFGLNVTEDVMIMPDDLALVKTWRTKAGKFLTEVLQHSVDSHLGWGFVGASMHDPCPILYLVKPELFEMKDMYVHVETAGFENFGRTTGDPLGRWKRKPNMKAAVKVDIRGAVEFMLGRLESLP